MLELVVVVGIIAILAVMAVPAFIYIVPSAHLRGSARSVVSLMQQARLMAGNTQKPARLTLDCRTPTASSLCEARLETAVFKHDGTFKEWVPAGGETRRALARKVDVAAAAAPDSAMVKGDPEARVFWAVFLPSGRAHASHEPFRLVFSRPGAGGRTWELAVNRESGRATLRWLQ